MPVAADSFRSLIPFPSVKCPYYDSSSAVDRCKFAVFFTSRDMSDGSRMSFQVWLTERLVWIPVTPLGFDEALVSVSPPGNVDGSSLITLSSPLSPPHAIHPCWSWYLEHQIDERIRLSVTANMCVHPCFFYLPAVDSMPTNELVRYWEIDFLCNVGNHRFLDVDDFLTKPLCFRRRRISGCGATMTWRDNVDFWNLKRVQENSQVRQITDFSRHQWLSSITRVVPFLQPPYLSMQWATKGPDKTQRRRQA